MAKFGFQGLLQGGFFGRPWSGDKISTSSTLRLLVVDGTDQQADKIAKILPPNVELVREKTFSDAETTFIEDPPDAAVFCIVPCFSMWRVLIDKCLESSPMIPFICSAKIEANPPCSCAVPCRAEDLLTWDLPMAGLEQRVMALVDECRNRDPERFRPGRAALPEMDQLRAPQFDIIS